MPDTTSASLQLVDQTTGGNENTWGDIADLNFAKIEQAIAMTSIIAVSGGSVTPDSDTIRKALLIFTGALASNQIVIVANAQKLWSVKNTTTGNFTLTIKTAAGASVIVPRGSGSLIYCDGADVNFLRPEKIPFAVATGTADAITAAFSPAITSEFLVDGLILAVRAAFANATTTPSLTPDGIGTGTVSKYNNQALSAGDIAGAGQICLFSYASATTSWQLLNPIASVTLNGNNAFTGNETHAGLETFNGKVQLNGGVATKEQTVTWVSSPTAISIDVSQGADAVLTLLGAATLIGPLANQSSNVGARGQLRFIQDATGSRAITFDTVCVMADGTALSIDLAPNSETTFNYWVKSGSGAGSIILTPRAGYRMGQRSAVSTSGTTIDFNNIPTWAKRITVSFFGVSLTGADNIIVQMGPSGTPETSGYVSASLYANVVYTTSTAGFLLSGGSAAGSTNYGSIVITNITGFSYSATSIGARIDSAQIYDGAGGKTFSGTPNIVRVLTTGANSFDAGTIGLLYEG